MIYIVGKGIVGNALTNLLRKHHDNYDIYAIGKEEFDNLPTRLRKGDIIINAATTEINEVLLKLCLSKKCHYIDMGSDLSDGTCEQWRYCALFKENRLRGVFNAGLAPGFTNLLAKKAFDEGIKDIKLRYLEKVGPKPVFLWSPYIATADKESQPIRWRNGRIEVYDKKPFSFSFPSGERCLVYPFLHDEVASIGPSLQPRLVEVAIGGALECKEVFKEEMWGKDIKEMKFLACVENFDEYLMIDYEELIKRGIKENVIAFGTAFFVATLLEYFDTISSLIPPELLPEDVQMKLLESAKRIGWIIK
jgi:hypothetical protein